MPAAPPADRIVTRAMRPDEFSAMRTLAMSAFDDDPSIGVLLDLVHGSWSWIDELVFVAELDGALVGQVLYGRALLDTPRDVLDVLLLAPVSVRPDLQGVGVGTRMIEDSLAAVLARHEPLVFLEGHPRYYPRFGFERAADLGFDSPSPRIPPAAFMVYRLPGYRSWMTGRLVYPDAFWRAGAVGPGS